MLALAALDGLHGDTLQRVHQFLGLLDVDKATGDDIRPGDDTAILGAQVHADHNHAVLS